MSDHKQIFLDKYNEIYKQKRANGEKETQAQKFAIRDTLIFGLQNYQDVDAVEIWKAIHAAHIHRKSGFSNVEIINLIISAENSWKKSSGHAFEEVLPKTLNSLLQPSSIEIIMQRDLTVLMKAGEISNHARDLNWLDQQIATSAFDLYMLVNQDEKKLVFGCVQAKTSIRERVTREREPSSQAMEAFFWSVAIVLDGDFLRLAKFKQMVNGGSKNYPDNGWHGMYVFSENYVDDRIYFIGHNFDTFVSHARTASHFWLTQRQWLNKEWRADKEQ